MWYVVSKYPKDSFQSKGLKLEKDSIIRMGRVRLRVRDIDYPEVKQEAENKSQKSWSPRSRGNKTGVSSCRKNSNDSQLEINDIDLSQRGEIRVEGVAGLDGGIELAPENIDA